MPASSLRRSVSRISCCGRSSIRPSPCLRRSFRRFPRQSSRGPRATLLGALYPLRSERHRLRHALGRAGRGDRYVAVADAARLRPDESASVRQRRSRSGRHACRRPSTRRVGHARRLAARGREPDRSPRIVMRRSSPSSPSGRSATRSCSANGCATLSRRPAGDTVASGWFVQGQQTITPRWFAAGRVERMAAPALTPLSTIEQQHLNGVEETHRIPADAGAHAARRPSRAPRIRAARIRSPDRRFRRVVETVDVTRQSDARAIPQMFNC